MTVLPYNLVFTVFYNSLSFLFSITERGMMIAEYQSRMSRNYRSRLSKLDRYVIKKHKDIYPIEKELSFILQLVTNTEESIKKVAETVNALENEPTKKIRSV